MNFGVKNRGPFSKISHLDAAEPHCEEDKKRFSPLSWRLKASALSRGVAADGGSGKRLIDLG